MGVVTFNGKSSTEFGVSVQHPPQYQIPQREYQVTHVPGRNGDILIDTGSYENAERVYDFAILKKKNESYTEAVGKVIAWLHSASGYSRLEDSYEPDYYRLAYYQDSISVSNLFMTAGVADIRFICKPQRFLKSGETSVSIGNGQTVIDKEEITNPTGFNSRPLIYVSDGTGKIEFYNSSDQLTGSVEVLENDGGIYIDCTRKDAYNFDATHATINKNSSISLEEFPEFSPGKNFLKTSNSIKHLIITPNWWTL